MKKQVWLNLKTGEFTDSWVPIESGYNATTKLLEDVNDINERTKGCWKLIEYECLNDEDFEFFNLMKLR